LTKSGALKMDYA